MHEKLIKEYIDLWESAQTTNGSRTDEFDSSITYLTWRGHDMAYIRDNDVNEPIYVEMVELEEHMDMSMVSLSKCSLAMGKYIGNVGILEAICQEWDEVSVGHANDIVFTVDGVEYGAIQFSQNKITFRTRDNNGDSPIRRGLEAMLQYSSHIAKQVKRVDANDDIVFIKSLMKL